VIHDNSSNNRKMQARERLLIRAWCGVAGEGNATNKE